MSKFKVGDRVRNKGNGDIDIVRLMPGMFEYDGYDFHDSESGFILKNYSWEYQKDWEKIDKTFSDLEVGDILVDTDGDERVVLGVCGKLVFLSKWADQDEYDGIYTIKELQDEKFTIKQPTPDPVDTIDLMGKTYNKSDIESALKDVKPLN